MTEDVAKWDYVLAHLDDQSGACSKILWALSSDDEHDIGLIDYRQTGAMLGCIPTAAQDPVYAARRTALKDMFRRGSTVILPKNSKCGIPMYTFAGAQGAAESLVVSVYVDNIGNADSAEMRFYGCDWATGSTPGVLLCSRSISLNQSNSVAYHLTQTGNSGDPPLTVQQKANIKYVRPVLVWTVAGAERTAYFQPVRIRSTGDWWDGPDYTLSGAQGVVGPSPYPLGGSDTGETVYFNSHSHSLASDGNATPAAVRQKYWNNYGGLDPTKPRFDIITDHNTRTPFTYPTPNVVVLKEGALLYGGFTGGETSKDQRDPSANPTTIDGQSAGRCVLADATGWTRKGEALLDGFLLANGKAESDCGGGVLCVASSLRLNNCVFTNNEAYSGGAMCASYGATPALSKCVFRQNRATGPQDGGGGVYSSGARPTFTDCRFEGNTGTLGGGICGISSNLVFYGCAFAGNVASGDGGGIHVSRGSMRAQSCQFSENQATSGGGIAAQAARVSIAGCSFIGDTANAAGGAIWNSSATDMNLDTCVFRQNQANGCETGGGALFSRKSSGKVVNCLFVGNSASGTCGRGGAIYLENDLTPSITNNTLIENNAFEEGGICTWQSDPRIFNNIIAWNSSGIRRSGGNPILSHNDVYGNPTPYQDIGPGIGDIAADPAFANPAAGDYHLTPASPCVNSGTDSAASLPPFDFEGEGRVYDGIVDIGMDEIWPIPADAKRRPDGASVTCSAAVVTAAFDGFLYIETDDRVFGIRVEKQDHGLSAGMRADVEGICGTSTDGERCIQARAVAQHGFGSVAPLKVQNRFVGGCDYFYNPETGAGQRGVKGGVGLNNIGLLIQIGGRFTRLDAASFLVEDGSNNAIRCVVPAGVVLDPAWRYVALTGISSCRTEDSDTLPLLRVRGQADIQVVQ